jgi:hypothetical protein
VTCQLRGGRADFLTLAESAREDLAERDEWLESTLFGPGSPISPSKKSEVCSRYVPRTVLRCPFFGLSTTRHRPGHAGGHRARDHLQLTMNCCRNRNSRHKLSSSVAKREAGQGAVGGPPDLPGRIPNGAPRRLEAENPMAPPLQPDALLGHAEKIGCRSPFPASVHRLSLSVKVCRRALGRAWP